VWLALADNYLNGLCIDWEKTKTLAFNRKSNPDDNKLGLQIVKVGKIISFMRRYSRSSVKNVGSGSSVNDLFYLLFSAHLLSQLFFFSFIPDQNPFFK